VNKAEDHVHAGILAAPADSCTLTEEDPALVRELGRRGIVLDV
jgi:hypothetical protein